MTGAASAAGMPCSLAANCGKAACSSRGSRCLAGPQVALREFSKESPLLLQRAPALNANGLLSFRSRGPSGRLQPTHMASSADPQVAQRELSKKESALYSKMFTPAAHVKAPAAAETATAETVAMKAAQPAEDASNNAAGEEGSRVWVVRSAAGVGWPRASG